MKRLRQQRINRPGATLRHHQFDGSGTIAVQLIRRRDDPRRFRAVVAALDGKYHNYFRLPWTDPEVWKQMSASQQRRAGRVVARFRYGRSADGQLLRVELPVQQHRQLPDDADITGARLPSATRRQCRTVREHLGLIGIHQMKPWLCPALP